jgi:hypothetical protein
VVIARLTIGRRSLGLLLALLAALLVPALVATGRADDVPASVRYAVGSPAMLAAQSIAVANWGGSPCGGAIDISWGQDDPTINARSYWANPRSAYDDPQLNTGCRIVFNVSMAFTWEKFCTVLVHEYGHLSGRPHTADGPDLMSPIYRAALPACSGTPDPSAAPSAAAPAAAPPAAAPAAPIVVDALAPARSVTTKSTRTRTARPRARGKAAKAKTARAASAPLERFSSADSIFEHR